MAQDFISNTEWDENLVQLKAIVGGMGEGVVAFDAQGKIYFANRQALTLYGVRRIELRNSIHDLDPLFEVHDLEGNVLPEEAYPSARLLRGETFSDYRVWIQRKGERRSWIGSYNGAQVMDTVPLCVRSVRDVTAQVELEERHKATFDMNPTAMSVVRMEDLLFTEVNESFLKLTGYDRDEVVGKTADQLKLRLERDKRETALERIRSGREDSIIEHEATLRIKSGEQRVVLSEGRVIRFDSEPHLIDTYLDITERKRSESELSQAVQAAMSDPSWFVKVVQEKLYEIRAGTAVKPGLNLLSPREVEVLSGMARGLSNEQIAQELKLATQTVRNYISTIYDKLGVHSRTEAVIWARERGLIFPS